MEMNKESVIELMKSSQSEEDWNNNVDRVKAAFTGYPDWWFAEIVASGLLKETAAKWGGAGEIQITSL
jgi:hypothetical protein